jgi:hypothetical protein
MRVLFLLVSRFYRCLENTDVLIHELYANAFWVHYSYVLGAKRTRKYKCERGRSCEHNGSFPHKDSSGFITRL